MPGRTQGVHTSVNAARMCACATCVCAAGGVWVGGRAALSCAECSCAHRRSHRRRARRQDRHSFHRTEAHYRGHGAEANRKRRFAHRTQSIRRIQHQRLGERRPEDQCFTAAATCPETARAEQPVRDFVGKEMVVGVRLGNTKGRMSEWSNFVAITVEAPLAKPADVKAEGVPEGVRLTWSEPNLTAFRIFRKAERAEGADAARQLQISRNTWTPPPNTERPTNITCRESTTKPKATWWQSNSITPKDIFPPQVPTGLTASVGIGAIELAWTRNTESDFKEYRVFRSEENGPYIQIAAGLEAPVYSDHQIESGKHYRYRVSAVDQAGNQSQPSEPIEVTAP